MMEFEGNVEEFANGKFKVKVSDNYSVLCTLSGKIRQSQIKIIAGDRVKIEVSAYDTKLGRIIYRLKNSQ
jgi:translation initiation factor IF-1